jgi:hypothetical protein
MEGLGDIIIGTGIDPGDLVTPAITRSQDQNGHVPARGAPLFKDRDAVHFRQTDIKNNSIIGFAFTEIVPLLAIKSLIDHITAFPQRLSELAIEILVIFDNKYAHGL